MNAFGSMLCDSSVAPTPLPKSVRSICCRLEAFPCEPGLLADRILSPGERDYWNSMRGVEKRRHEWLLGRCAAKDAVRLLMDPQLSPAEIEIVPDAYGCPRVAGGPVISIAHSQGVAVALAAIVGASWRAGNSARSRLSAGSGRLKGGCGQDWPPSHNLMVGVDLESLSHGRENYEAIAFHPDERRLLADLPSDSRQEWALRMWCAKEAVGKALGRGLSAGLLAFHITRIETATGNVALELRDGALEQFPHLRGKLLTIYTVRESKFVFSAIIYQQGAVRMRPSRQEILDYLLQKMGELTQDWDYPDPVRPESLLFTELGFESLDAVVLCTAIQEHYQTPMPFAELLAEIGQQQRDLSIDELANFVNTHLGGTAGAESVTRRLQ